MGGEYYSNFYCSTRLTVAWQVQYFVYVYRIIDVQVAESSLEKRGEKKLCKDSNTALIPRVWNF